MAAADGRAEESWWGGWLHAARQKSTEAFQFVKKDLQEFTATVQEDSVKVAGDVKSRLTQENASAATRKMKQGVSKVIDGISKALVIEADDGKKVHRKNAGEPIFDRATARLRAVQLDPGTYCEDPQNVESYREWLQQLDLNHKKGDISELLVSNADMRSLYTQMVPSQVSHADFWQRYFFRVHELKKDEERKAELMKRADTAHDDPDMEWDDDWCDVAGPASPPKSAAGSLQAAMQAEKVNIDDDQDNPAEVKPEMRIPIIKAEQDPQDNIPSLEARNPPQHEHKVDNVVNETDNLAEPDSESSTSKNKESAIETIPWQMEPSKETHASSATEESQPKCEKVCVTDPLKIDTDIKTKDKGDLVVVGSLHTTPSSDSTAAKEVSSADDDWEKDFDDDIEITEEDMKLAAEAEKKLAEIGIDVEDNDWENWD